MDTEARPDEPSWRRVAVTLVLAMSVGTVAGATASKVWPQGDVWQGAVAPAPEDRADDGAERASNASAPTDDTTDLTTLPPSTLPLPPPLHPPL
ncbi:hypothetical protein, partial [Chondromyces apiculatus]|uniref:hypothetical protein n=1 Tax=Chondromyces apiculatus TaxID=51 RepID=UPI0005C5F999